MSAIYAVKAEMHDGKTVVVRKGFTSQEAAEDFPVVASRYKRVWVEELPEAPPRQQESWRAKPTSLAIRDGAAFAAIEQAAIAGERCPQTSPHGPIPTGSVSRLARAGKIRSEIFAGNFRRVTICVGPHAGKSTAAPPKGSGLPYKVIGPPAIRRATGDAA